MIARPTAKSVGGSSGSADGTDPTKRWDIRQSCESQIMKWTMTNMRLTWTGIDLCCFKETAAAVKISLELPSLFLKIEIITRSQQASGLFGLYDSWISVAVWGDHRHPLISPPISCSCRFELLTSVTWLIEWKTYIEAKDVRQYRTSKFSRTCSFPRRGSQVFSLPSYHCFLDFGVFILQKLSSKLSTLDSLDQ